jgi:hypothetical protein
LRIPRRVTSLVVARAKCFFEKRPESPFISRPLEASSIKRSSLTPATFS